MDLQTPYLPTNTKVYVKNLRDDLGVLLVEGNIILANSTVPLKAVRFFSPPLTSKGREYLSGKLLLTPHGKIQRIYCLPTNDLVPVSNQQKSEKQNERRQKGKTRKKTI